MTPEQVKEIIYRELPAVMREDAALREFVLKVASEKFAEKETTEDRIDRVLEEMRQEREENNRRWEENNRRWEESNRRLEEDNRRWEENNRRWEEKDQEWKELIVRSNQRYDSTIGALGARWGIYSESSFRNALKGILEDSFQVSVTQFTDMDFEGKVFGRPEQVELDVIIFNGTLILCEIKSSCTKAELYSFWRKTTWYEEKHGRRADRKIVISPMVDAAAKKAADELKIEVYSYPDQVSRERRSTGA